MSLTKRYLESLPADEQDAILGRPDEWTDDAENEPDVIERILSGDLNAMIHNLDLCVQEQAENEPTEEELAEWARALMEEEEEEDRFTERDEAPLVKPEPKRVDCEGWSI